VHYNIKLNVLIDKKLRGQFTGQGRIGWQEEKALGSALFPAPNFIDLVTF